MREHTSALEAAKGKGLFRGEPGKDKEVEQFMERQRMEGMWLVI